MYVNFLNLLTSFKCSVAKAMVTSAMDISIISTIRLFRLHPQPSNVSFQVTGRLFNLNNVQMGINVKDVRTYPFPAVSCTIIIYNEKMITGRLLTNVPTMGMPPLNVMLPRHLARMVNRPHHRVMVIRLRRPNCILQSSGWKRRHTACQVIGTLMRIMTIFRNINGNDRISLRRIIRITLSRSIFTRILHSNNNSVSPRIVRIIGIYLRILFNRIV